MEPTQPNIQKIVAALPKVMEAIDELTYDERVRVMNAAIHLSERPKRKWPPPNFITLSGVIEEEKLYDCGNCGPEFYSVKCPVHYPKQAAPHPEKCAVCGRTSHGPLVDHLWKSAPLPLAKEIEELPKRKERVGESFGDIVADGLDAHEDKINEIVRYLRRHTGR